MDNFRPNFTSPELGHRILHGRGGGFSGLSGINVDFYEPLAHFSVYEQTSNEILENLINQVKSFLGEKLKCIVIQSRFKKHDQWELYEGSLPEKIIGREKDIEFLLELFKNQNTGFFPDMLPGRNWLRENSKDKKILNLFSYTCALSLVAIKNGASKVINIDMSRSSLNMGRENHRINNLPMDKVEFRQIDIMKSLGSISKKGPYDLIIIDPPSFQKGSFDASKDYLKIIKRLDSMLNKGGKVMACLNSPFYDSNFLKSLFENESKNLIFKELLYRDVNYKEVDPEKGLKILIYEKLP